VYNTNLIEATFVTLGLTALKNELMQQGYFVLIHELFDNAAQVFPVAQAISHQPHSKGPRSIPHQSTWDLLSLKWH
jgi:hypothetical protein